MALVVAVAALTTMALGAGTAKGQAIGAEFDNAWLKAGGIPGNGLDICCDSTMAPDIIEFNGNISGGAPPNTQITVTPAGVIVPEFSGLIGGGLAYVEVNLTALENVTGTVGTADPANTTVVTNPSDYLATLLVDLTDPKDGADGDTCALGDPPGMDDGGAPGADDTPDLELAFNTTQPYPSPYAGDPFTFDGANLATDALDNGAMVATWASLPAAIHTAGPDGEGDDCALVNGLTSGRGGLWVASEVATPALNQAPAEGGGGGANPGDNRNEAAYKVCLKKAKKLKKSKRKKAIKKCKAKFGF